MQLAATKGNGLLVLRIIDSGQYQSFAAAFLRRIPPQYPLF
jgi:hypothetical protein